MRPQGGVSVVVTAAERTPPLDRFNFKSNAYSGNVVVGAGSIARAARDGFATLPIPAGWAEAQESAARRPLTAADVGPAWVIALRQNGQFPMEDVATEVRPATSEPRPKKKKR